MIKERQIRKEMVRKEIKMRRSLLIDMFRRLASDDGVDILKMNQSIGGDLNGFVEGKSLDVVFRRVCEVFEINVCDDIDTFVKDVVPVVEKYFNEVILSKICPNEIVCCDS